MSLEITITPMEPGWYGVQVVEARDTDDLKSVRVQVPDDLFEAGLPDADPEVLIHESIAFLLDKEPATAILPEFSLAQIADYFPDYPEEIRARLGAA
jgi:hypothetical protein